MCTTASICDRKRSPDFPETCLQHWRNMHRSTPTLYLEGVVYVDDAQRKVVREATGREPARLSCNEFSREEIRGALRLTDVPLLLRHQDQIGTIFGDAYDEVPGLNAVSGVFIYAAIPLAGPRLDSRVYVATKLLMPTGATAEACDLSMKIDANFFEGRVVADDTVFKTLREVSVMPEKNGNRADCSVTRALLVTHDGRVIPSIRGE